MRSFDLKVWAFIFIWLGVWILSYIVEYVHHASVWFPPAGLTFAALLVIGKRILPALFICAVVSTMWTGVLYHLDETAIQLIVPGAVFAVTHITPYYLGTLILKRLAHIPYSDLPRLVLAFLVIAVVCSFVTAFLVLWGLELTNLIPEADIAGTWLPFWIGDMTGVIALGPVFIGLLLKYHPVPEIDIGELRTMSNPGNVSQFVCKLFLCGLLITAIMFFSYYVPVKESYFAIFFVLIPIMWISYTESPTRIAISIALFSTYVVFLVNLLGLMQNVMVYQFAICSISASAFFYISIPTLLAHNQDLQQKTQTDALTGVASRHYLLEKATVLVRECQNANRPLALIILDIDKFKQINDTFGHSRGDEALKEVTLLVRSHLRDADFLARYGGDEFVILLPETALQKARNITERILNNILLANILPNQSLSCSFGISELRENEDFGQLFERADQALYRAKESGRSQVQCG
ncbi:diguanylate cyclase [Vibrio salinus]|uniref:diguanylate cyclase n=1 Tax=Vibrio salinus TaxID=2899784 RepID=UPI001E291AE4|nr:diguanylate cyclase [Vibrio salinus]MCE0495073.1 diguanylate cyclase [Vibrio salinus]